MFPARSQGNEDALKAHNLEMARRINEGGRAYLTPSMLKGKQMLRVSIGAEATERGEVEALWTLLNEAAAEIAVNPRSCTLCRVGARRPPLNSLHGLSAQGSGLPELFADGVDNVSEGDCRPAFP